MPDALPPRGDSRAGYAGARLRLAASPDEFPATFTNGPGRRFAVWVQGCSLRCCTRCLNPELLVPAGGVDVTPADLVARAIGVRQRWGIEGVTILGGEPFDQAEAVASVARAAHDLGLSVVVYTGWLVERLAQRAEGSDGLRRLLDEVDMLVEGPHDEAYALPGTLWRGSANQRIVLMSERYGVAGVREGLLAWASSLVDRVEVLADDHGLCVVSRHWAERVPSPAEQPALAGLAQAVEVVPLDLGGRAALAWVPELRRRLVGEAPLPSPKGIAAVVKGEGIAGFYGFQTEDTMGRLRASLAAAGVVLEGGDDSRGAELPRPASRRLRC